MVSFDPNDLIDSGQSRSMHPDDPIQISIPHPDEAATILEHANWNHRWNTLFECREWRHFDTPWVRADDRVEARVRGDLRYVPEWMGKNIGHGFDVKPRIVAMQQLWGEITKTLDVYGDHQFTPHFELGCDPLPLESVMPWYIWLQRRYYPMAASLWQPEIVVKPGSMLLPPTLAQHLASTFYVMPLSLAGGASGRRSHPTKHTLSLIHI